MVFEPRLDHIEHNGPQEQEVATYHKKITAKKTPQNKRFQHSKIIHCFYFP